VAQAEVVGWIPGTPYSRATIRSTDLHIVKHALVASGIGIHYIRPLIHEDQRPPSASDLDMALFCYWLQPDRPLSSPEIKEAALEAFRAAGVPAMADEQHA
jgi:hypothetical protein